MKNAHLRFGWLTYVRSTEKAVTNIRLRLDRFIGEVLPDPPRQAKAHFISAIGGDTQISAICAAISMGERFMLEGSGVQPIRVCLERNAQCYKGSLQLAGRKKPLRHLIGVSEEFATSGTLSGKDRTLLADSEALFVWSSLAQIHGIPGIPDWAEWFFGQLEKHKAVLPMLGLGCNPVLVKGNKEQFLSWLSDGLWNGTIHFPAENRPIHWPRWDLRQTFFRGCGHELS
ncbi:MAG: hypothetical protein ABSA54_00160 [Terriglobales bacterium]